MSIKDRVAAAAQMAAQQGRVLSANHFSSDSPETLPLSLSLSKPQTGLGLRRSNHKPIPRKNSPEDAETMRALHGMGLGYRALGKAFSIAPGCAHHAVTKRGAYRYD